MIQRVKRIKYVSRRKTIFIVLIMIISFGFMIPEKRVMPVKGASSSDWNKKSFWYEPWGTSGVHKGIDVFAKKGTEMYASVNGVLLYHGQIKKGGKIVILLGPKWRLHYYAHLDSIAVFNSRFIRAGEKIGTVGDSGNAKGKLPHLHYSVMSVFPYFWLATTETQGWKKMFYLDPKIYL